MSYQWKKAFANAVLVFIGCFLAKIPAGDSFAWNWPELKHVLITCGTITLFAELRYIYSALAKWADNGGNMKLVPCFLLIIFVGATSTGCDSKTISAYINLAEQITLQAATLAGAPQSVIDKVSGDLTAANKLYTDLSSASNKDDVIEKIDGYLTVAQADMNSILMLASVKDPKVIAAVRAGLALGIVAIEGIYAIANQNHVSTQAKVYRPLKALTKASLPSIIISKDKTISPAQLKKQYNETMKDFPSAQVR